MASGETKHPLLFECVTALLSPAVFNRKDMLPSGVLEVIAQTTGSTWQSLEEDRYQLSGSWQQILEARELLLQILSTADKIRDSSTSGHKSDSESSRTADQENCAVRESSNTYNSGKIVEVEFSSPATAKIPTDSFPIATRQDDSEIQTAMETTQSDTELQQSPRQTSMELPRNGIKDINWNALCAEIGGEGIMGVGDNQGIALVSDNGGYFEGDLFGSVSSLEDLINVYGSDAYNEMESLDGIDNSLLNDESSLPYPAIISPADLQENILQKVIVEQLPCDLSSDINDAVISGASDAQVITCLPAEMSEPCDSGSPVSNDHLSNETDEVVSESGDDDISSNSKSVNPHLVSSQEMCPSCCSMYSILDYINHLLNNKTCAQNIRTNKVSSRSGLTKSLLECISTREWDVVCPVCEMEGADVATIILHYVTSCKNNTKQKQRGKYHFFKEHDVYWDAAMKVFCCPYCTSKSPQRKHLKIHIERFHLPKIIKCSECDKRFATVYLLKSHVRKAHNVARRVNCGICGLSVSSGGIKRHQLVAHGKKVIQCDQCNYVTNNKQYLAIHKTQHDASEKCLCDFCGKGFALECQLKAHQKQVHLKENNQKGKLKPKEATCHICGQTLLQKNMTVHMRRKHNQMNPFICEVCGEFFQSKNALKVHSKSHLTNDNDMTNSTDMTDNPSISSYHCDLCKETFSIAVQYKEHMLNVHQSEKPFTCEKCHQTFGWKSSYKKHLQKACKGFPTTVKPKCYTCGSEFGDNKMLKEHLFQDHELPLSNRNTPCDKPTEVDDTTSACQELQNIMNQSQNESPLSDDLPSLCELSPSGSFSSSISVDSGLDLDPTVEFSPNKTKGTSFEITKTPLMTSSDLQEIDECSSALLRSSDKETLFVSEPLDRGLVSDLSGAWQSQPDGETLEVGPDDVLINDDLGNLMLLGISDL